MAPHTYSNSDHDYRLTAKPSVMLLPTKVSEIQVTDHGNGVDGVVSFVPFPFGTSSRWTAQPVLKWIESLATATTTTTTKSLSDGAAVQEGYSEIVPDTNAVLSDLSHPTPANLFSSTHLLDQKRSPTPTLLDESSVYTHCEWDLSFVDQHDPSAYMYTRKMKHLAGNFEQLMTTAKTTKKFQDMSLAYQMVQSRFNFTFDRIVWQNLNHRQATHSAEVDSPDISRGNYENRQLLNALYEEICQKLQNITSAFEKNSKGLGSIHGPSTVVSQPNLEEVKGSQHQDVSKSMKKHQTKQELGKYMTSWLRSNFTNPYPDDEGLIQMANHCGTTNQVISNWLINARTRKWRPAIIKATELGRPADLLLEDSINVFDGKPVRPIAMYESASASSCGHPAMITPIRPDISSSLNPFQQSSHGNTTENDCQLEPLPAAKRQKRLHIVTTTSKFSKSSLPRATNRHGPPLVVPSAPKSLPRGNLVDKNTDQVPKLIFDDEDDDGILLESIQSAIDMESTSEGALTFDTNFFASTNTVDEEPIDVDALSPTFFNISNLNQALSRYKF